MSPVQITERLAELHQQRAKLSNRKKLDAKDSAVARRRQKIEREIADLESQKDQAIADEQQTIADRRRRMVLLLASAA